MARPALGAGDVVWVELDPVRGTEQSGRRPALVISSDKYNQVSTRVIICPITSTKRNWPFDVALPPALKTVGCVLVDQIRAIDRSQRAFRKVETVPRSVLDAVHDRLSALLRT